MVSIFAINTKQKSGKLMKLILTVILLFLIKSFVLSQSIIQGKIFDADSKNLLPSANIYIEGTYIGTISNNEGCYSLEIPSIPAVVVISYIGYRTRRLVIDNTGISSTDIALDPVILEAEGITVTADSEDPALGIMRKVIANKREWKQRLRSYSAKAYTRLKVENDKSIVSMSESISNLYWSAKSGVAEEFVAKRSSKRMPYLTEMEVGSKNIINLYEDDVPFFNHKFIGPTHPQAFDYYDFELLNERLRDSIIVFDIKVTPKSKLQPLFFGRISVLDDAFAMIDADLTTSESISFSEMIKSFRSNYRQQFSNFGKDFWLLIESRSRQEVEIDMGVLAFPEAIFVKNTRVSNYLINVDISRDLTRIDTVKESLQKLRKNVSAFDNFEKIPLTAKELIAYNNPDTTMTLLRSFPPTGILVGYMKSKEKDLEDALRSHGDYTPLSTDSDFDFLGWYNRVEGFHLGMNYKYKYHHHYHIMLEGGYQTAPKKPVYKARFHYQINKKGKNTFFYGGYYDQTDCRYNSGHYNQLFASILPLFGFGDYFDYYQNKKMFGGFKYTLTDKNSELSIELQSADHSSLKKNTNCNILNKNYHQRINPAIDEGRLNSIRIDFKYDESYGLPSEAKLGDLPSYNRIDFQIEHSSPHLFGSDFDFTQFNLLADYTMNTFFKRRPDPNYLRARIAVSTYRGDLPLQRFSIIDGNLYSYAPFGVFKTQINKPLEGEKNAALFWEYNFKSIPFEVLGLSYFARNKYEFLIHGSGGHTWIDRSRLHQINQNYKVLYEDDLHKELGLALKIKYKFVSIRLDVTRNLETQNDYFGFTAKLIGLSF
jgi:hypothetical protein